MGQRIGSELNINYNFVSFIKGCAEQSCAAVSAEVTEGKELNSELVLVSPGAEPRLSSQ